MSLRATIPAVILILAVSGALAQDAVYRPHNKYPVLDEMTRAYDARRAERDSLRKIVDDRYAAEAKAKKDAARDLRVDWSQVVSPSGPDAFDRLWHNPPVPQFYTGTCWAFSSVSFMESEAHRIAGVDVKLSEMWVVYWEYVEKCRSYLREYGHTPVDEGGESDGTLAIYAKYGAAPASAYPGVLSADGRHDHRELIAELKGYLKWVLDSGDIDIERNLKCVRGILDAHLGPVPETFTYQGDTYDPQTFLHRVLQLDPGAYVSCVSDMRAPFGERMLFDVHDNWRRSQYLNLSLGDFMAAIDRALDRGYTVAIGGDNSEPGMDGKFDRAIIPVWDIPSEFIDQASRQMRIENGTTGDDHGVHLVGRTTAGGHTWYLIKDSNRSSRLGEFKGYYMWRDDYIKLKMLSFTVHRDILED